MQNLQHISCGASQLFNWQTEEGESTLLTGLQWGIFLTLKKHIIDKSLKFSLIFTHGPPHSLCFLSFPKHTRHFMP
jgi:hypothetical protein